MISNTLCLCNHCNSIIFITELYMHKCNNYINEIKKEIKEEIKEEIKINTFNNKIKYLNYSYKK